VALSSETIACESSRKELNPKVASAGTFEDVSCGVPVPTPRITASVTDFPIITSDVTSNIPIAISAISETKSKIIGTYGNSGGNPSDGSTSTIKDDFTVQSETKSKASNIAPERG
jgi:hypothetical protein